MQEAYFRSDGFSQTRAVREAALAAHYVLRHHNRDVLPLAHINAASAVAALRGDVAFVALAGDAAAFAWRDGILSGQRGILRLPRPLGLEQDPRITLWSTPLRPRDRLVLVCGATWQPDSARLSEEILGECVADDSLAQQRIADALSDTRPAGVLVVDPTQNSRSARHLTVVPPRDRTQVVTVPPSADGLPTSGGGRRSWRRRVSSAITAIVLLGAAAVGILSPSSDLPRLSTLHQAEALLDQADQAPDVYQAHSLTASALSLLRRPASSAPAQYSMLSSRAATKLDAIDRVYPVNPAMAVRLGPSGSNVVDLAVGDDMLYTLDVVEATVRAFGVNGRDQQPTPDTLLVRTGATIGPGPRFLATPVAIQYVSGPRPEAGVLAIVDQARAVVEIGADRALNARPVPSSAAWREIGALGADLEGHLFVLDSGTKQLLEYPALGQRPVDPPRLVLDGSSAPGLAFDRAAEVVGSRDQIYLRMDDGTLRRFDLQGAEQGFDVRPPDGGPAPVSAIAPDRAGGLYLADPSHARVLHTTADGTLLRQLRNPALAGLRQIQSRPDGRRLYGLVSSGVLVFDLPDDAPPAEQ
jgi:hypothetical protein